MLGTQCQAFTACYSLAAFSRLTNTAPHRQAWRRERMDPLRQVLTIRLSVLPHFGHRVLTYSTDTIDGLLLDKCRARPVA